MTTYGAADLRRGRGVGLRRSLGGVHRLVDAQQLGPVRCGKGMRELPDHTLDDHPPLDVLLVPGGRGARLREPHNPAVTGRVATVAAEVNWVASVCTGAILLHPAGPARGPPRPRAQPHPRGVTVVGDARYVVDGI